MHFSLTLNKISSFTNFMTNYLFTLLPIKSSPIHAMTKDLVFQSTCPLTPKDLQDVFERLGKRIKQPGNNSRMHLLKSIISSAEGITVITIAGNKLSHPFISPTAKSPRFMGG